VGRGIAIVTLVAIELVVAGYAALMAFLMSAWSIHDTEAAQMAARDWWIIAAKRFVAISALGALLALIVFAVNRIAGRRFAIITAIVIFLIVAVSSGIGAFNFATTKPSM
jgi:hypothetical protein